MRRLAAVVLVSLVSAAAADAHAPATAIGRAVEVLGSVPISYDPGAAVTDLEADGFNRIAGSNPKVAFMPASAANELAGGPNAIAAEIAKEAHLDGTLVVLVGTRLGAWSDDIGDDRLAELVRDAEKTDAGSTAQVVQSLVRGVQAEPTGGPPWGWIGGGLVIFAIALLGADRLIRGARRRPQDPECQRE
jgi:hypothetical protein